MANRRTSEEDAVLTEFARNYLAGRRVLCTAARVIAALGAVATAAGAIIHFWPNISGFWSISR